MDVSLSPFAYASDSQTTLLLGDVRDCLRSMDAGSVHCAVTSPPYWGLRSYGVEGVEWADCWTGCLGLEPTPDQYATHLVDVFRDVRRVLRPDGVLWLNLGDSYAGSGGAHKAEHGNPGLSRSAERQGVSQPDRSSGDLKPLDLVGIPWLVAFALRADGWYLRSDSIWSKPNPMPESVSGWRWERCRVKVKVGLYASARDAVESMPSQAHHPGQVPRRQGSMSQPSPTEWEECSGCPKCEPNAGYILRRSAWRPTRAHEYMFMLTPSETYWCDQEAVREPLADSSIGRITQPTFDQQTGGEKDYRNNDAGGDRNRSARNGLEGLRDAYISGQSGRNPRDVWHIPTQPYPDAHFATYPERLIELPIRSSTSEYGCCPRCGNQWTRAVHHTGHQSGREPAYQPGNTPTKTDSTGWAPTREAADFWLPTCTHPEAWQPVPSAVLDPFSGSGTTCAVSRRLGLRSVGIDANESYMLLAMERIWKAAKA